MQYLSRAYQYYSGINPATLTGAIDVIVVEREGENASSETILACSPFHVRFGKLQVLRAGEKKVTLTVNSNPVPFFMKVGEAGEAFFVVETEEDVPEELLTSPLLGATEVGSETEPPDFSTNAEPSGSQAEPPASSSEENVQEASKRLKDEKFGVVPESDKAGAISEPDFLDLDSAEADVETVAEEAEALNSTDAQTTPRPNLSALPPTPQASTSGTYPSPPPSPHPKPTFLSAAPPTSDSSSQPTPSAPPMPNGIPSTAPHNVAASSLEPLPISEPLSTTTSSSQTLSPSSFLATASSITHTIATAAEGRRDHLKQYVEGVKTKNAVEHVVGHITGKKHGPGEGFGGKDKEGEDYEVAAEGGGDDLLPQVKEGEGKAPDVVYGDDVVLDMAGYKQQSSSPSSSRPSSPTRRRPSPSQEAHRRDQVARRSREASIDVVRDGQIRLSEGKGWNDDGVEPSRQVVSFAEDLLSAAAALETQAEASVEEAQETRSLSEHALNLEEKMDNLRLESKPEDSDAKPSSLQNLDIPPLSIPSTEYSWEWGELPTKSPAPTTAKFDFSTLASDDTPPARPSSLPPTPLDTSELSPQTDSFSPPPARPLRLSSYPPSVGRPTDKSDLNPIPVEGRLKNHEEDPYKFTFEVQAPGEHEKRSHSFELSLCGNEGLGVDSRKLEDAEAFLAGRVTFQRFIEEPELVDDRSLVVRYNEQYLTWHNASPVVASLLLYRKSLLPPPVLAPLPDSLLDDFEPTPVTSTDAASSEDQDAPVPEKVAAAGSGWSRWWRRSKTLDSDLPTRAEGQTNGSNELDEDKPSLPSVAEVDLGIEGDGSAPEETRAPGYSRSASEPPMLQESPLPSPPLTGEPSHVTHFAKTLRLSSDQLRTLGLKKGANTITFSVTSSYSGMASCTARIFLWDASDHIVISDIDGTITKSDALGHVFAAIGRDWTHLGVAKLYTDITNNGYKIMYLTSRAIGQADSTRDYLKGISQGNYQLPEGPVIMSPDRLMTSLHREVILRKPEVFKMACLRDIQRLFGGSGKAFYAGFGNRITDAMSYRSVNIPSSRIFTIDSNGEVKTELLELAGYKSSYIYMNDLVDQMFPPVHARWAPEFTDFNFWRAAPPMHIDLPDLSPPSPTLSARSDTSGRLSVLRNFTGSLRGSRASSPIPEKQQQQLGRDQRGGSSGPSSPLVGPVWTSDSEMSETEEEQMNDGGERRRRVRTNSMPGSLPGSMEEGSFFEDQRFDRRGDDDDDDEDEDGEGEDGEEGDEDGEEEDEDEEEGNDEIFDDDLLATGEMGSVPF